MTTRMTNSSSTLIDYIITDDYETGMVADTILKTDHFVTIAIIKHVNLKSNTKKNFFSQKSCSAIAFQNCTENSFWRLLYISKNNLKSISTTCSNESLLY